MNAALPERNIPTAPMPRRRIALPSMAWFELVTFVCLIAACLPGQ